MELYPHPRCSHRRLENLALFGTSFTIGQVALYAADKLYDPHTVDVPQGGAIALGLVVSGLSAAVFDRAVHH